MLHFTFAIFLVLMGQDLPCIAIHSVLLTFPLRVGGILTLNFDLWEALRQ